MAPPRLDIIIYGASGFTGKVAVLGITQLMKKHHITWGVAGRSVSKLKQVLAEVSKKTGILVISSSFYLVIKLQIYCLIQLSLHGFYHSRYFS